MADRSEKPNTNKWSATDLLRLLPLVITISVTFLLVRAHEYTLPLSQFEYMAETDETPLFDCFSYIKAASVVVSASFAFVLLSFYLISGKRRIRKTVLYIPMSAYAVTIILSYICSDYRDFALFGTYDRFEGTPIHLCYLFIMFYAINCIDSERELKLIEDTLFAGVTIACLIGLSQFAGNDFFAGSIGKRLLLGTLTDEVTFNFGAGKVYQTVYNINYVGFYLCLVIPILISRILDTMASIRRYSASRKSYLAWLLILSLLIVINIIGSDSEGSLPGLAFGVAASLILRFGRQYKKPGMLILAGGYVLCFVLAQTGVFGSRYSLVSDDIQDRPQIEYIRTQDNTVEFMIDGVLFSTEYDEATGEFMLYKNGKSLKTFQIPDNEYRYEIDDSGQLMGKISFTPIIRDERIYALFDTKDQQWAFEYTPDGVRYINYSGNRVSLDDKTKHAGIIKNYSFGSGRGYIWDTTLPLVASHLFIGSGADTFMMEFPQDDYATRYSHALSTDCVYDKPHNMFLQFAINFGITGLVAFVAMIATTVFSCFKHHENGDKPNAHTVSILMGIIAFLISATVNDSSVQVMPMFYGLLGCVGASTPNFVTKP